MKTSIINPVAMLLLVGLLFGCQSPPDGQTERTDRDKKKSALMFKAPVGISTHTIYHEGRERYYILYKPASLPASTNSPLLLAFHGGGGIPENMMDMSGFNALADYHGFSVVYPSGSGSTPRRLFWNVLLSGTYATANKIDDIGFVRLVMDDVAGKVRIDTNRIFAAGFSQGGMLSYRLACDSNLSSRIAAIAVVGATMTVAPAACLATRAVPVISFHGKQDFFSSYAGGLAQKAPRNDQVARPGLAESIRYWVGKGNLPAKPSASGARGTARMEQFGPDESGIEVVSWTLEDGGHTWPGSQANLPEWMMGKVNRDIEASVLIWDFFSRHPLP